MKILHSNFYFLEPKACFRPNFSFCARSEISVDLNKWALLDEEDPILAEELTKKGNEIFQNIMFRALLKPILTMLFHFLCSRSSNLSSGRRTRSTFRICVAKVMMNGTSLTIVYKRFDPFEALFIQFLKISSQFQSNLCQRNSILLFFYYDAHLNPIHISSTNISII